MKQLKYWLMALLAVLTFASCDDLLNNDDNDEDKNPAWTDYFSMKVTRCERFGDNLLVNFDLKNISGKNLQGVELNGGNAFDRSKDDLGNSYYTNVSVSGGNWKTSPEFNLAKGESVSGSFLVKNYDKTNSSKKFDLVFSGSCESLDFGGRVEIRNNKVVDNRILQNGFDTNDPILTYKAVSCKMEQEQDGLSKEWYNVVYLTYQVKNNSASNVSSFEQNMGSWSQVKDNTSEGYNASIAIEDGNFATSQTTVLKAGETKKYTIKVMRVRDNATTLSGYIQVPESTYPWADTKVYFYDIKITK